MSQTSQRPKVLCVGSGGVGALAALALHSKNLSEVTLVVRSDYDHVSQHGYQFDSVTYGPISGWKPHHVARTVEEAMLSHGPFDFLVLTTKNIPDGFMTCEDIIAPAVSDETTIILMQNGLGIDGPMVERFPKNIVLSAVSLVGSTNINCVVRNTLIDRSLLGVFDSVKVPISESEAKVAQFIELYLIEGKNKIEVDPNVKKTRWQKLVYNLVMNTMSAITDQDVNRMQIAVANQELMAPAMAEVIAIAASDGVDLGSESIEKFLHIGDGLFYLPLMCVDMRKKQLMELEIILGNPLKIARANGVSTPILLTFYHLLHIVQLRIKEQLGLILIDENAYQGHSSDEYPAIFQALARK